jgi:hypothetical protein
MRDTTNCAAAPASWKPIVREIYKVCQNHTHRSITKMSRSDDDPAGTNSVTHSTERLGASADGTWERLAVIGISKYNGRIDTILIR